MALGSQDVAILVKRRGVRQAERLRYAVACVPEGPK